MWEVSLACGIAAVSKLIANFINGVGGAIVYHAVSICTIVGVSNATCDNLHILVAVVAFFLRETYGGVYLVTQRFQIAGSGACAVDKTAGAHHCRFICIVVAVVDKHIALESVVVVCLNPT